MKFLKENWFKIIVAISIIVITYAVFYHLVIINAQKSNLLEDSLKQVNTEAGEVSVSEKAVEEAYVNESISVKPITKEVDQEIINTDQNQIKIEKCKALWLSGDPRFEKSVLDEIVAQVNEMNSWQRSQGIEFDSKAYFEEVMFEFANQAYIKCLEQYNN